MAYTLRLCSDMILTVSQRHELSCKSAPPCLDSQVTEHHLHDSIYGKFSLLESSRESGCNPRCALGLMQAACVSPVHAALVQEHYPGLPHQCCICRASAGSSIGPTGPAEAEVRCSCAIQIWLVQECFWEGGRKGECFLLMGGRARRSVDLGTEGGSAPI